MWNVSAKSIADLASELGRPSVYYITMFAKAMPECGYRIVTFFIYYICVFLVWNILKAWLNLRDSSCRGICALYAVIPANDARIVLSTFPYTIGLFLFMLALVLFLIVLHEENRKKRIFYRILDLLLFFISFILNSNLSFYGIVLLIILLRQKNIFRMFKYVDYCILPIAFFVLKTVLFPSYGRYENYNTVSMKNVIYAIKTFFLSDFWVIANLVWNWTYINRFIITGISVLLLVWALVRNWGGFQKLLAKLSRKIDEEKLDQTTIEFQELLKILLVGICVLSFGVFSYIVVRGTYRISITGLTGRDAILVGLGSAMIIYAGLKLTMKDNIAKMILSVMLICGIVFFNRFYLSYQQDYYRQLGLQCELEKQDELANSNNIEYINDDDGLINIQHFYQLNGNAQIVYGNQKRLIAPNLSQNLETWNDLNSVCEKEGCHMLDYDLSNKKIDAIIDYSFDANIQDTAKLKFYEIFSRELFEEKIDEYSQMSVIWK